MFISKKSRKNVKQDSDLFKKSLCKSHNKVLQFKQKTPKVIVLLKFLYQIHTPTILTNKKYHKNVKEFEKIIISFFGLGKKVIFFIV